MLLPSSVDPGPATLRIEWLMAVPACFGPALGVALRAARETYETAALPLSYVGADPEWPMLVYSRPWSDQRGEAVDSPSSLAASTMRSS